MQGWKVDKHIPLALIITMALQISAFIWYAARQDYKLDEHERVINNLMSQLPQSTERLYRVEEKVISLKEQVSRVETKLDKVVSRTN